MSRIKSIFCQISDLKLAITLEPMSDRPKIFSTISFLYTLSEHITMESH